MGRGEDGAATDGFDQDAAPDGGEQHGQPELWRPLLTVDPEPRRRPLLTAVESCLGAQQAQPAPWAVARRAAKANAAGAREVRPTRRAVLVSMYVFLSD